MLIKSIYAASVVAMYSVFLTQYKKQHKGEPVCPSHRVATFIVAIFWPLTVAISAAMVALGMFRERRQIVGTNGALALKWLAEHPETPVILADVHGRHMMKAVDVASKIRGGVCPTQVRAYTGHGGWEHLDIQEVTE